MLATARSIAKSVVPQRLRDFIRPYINEDVRDAQFRAMDRRLSREVFEQTGGRIIAGPFAGMEYLSGNLVGSFLCPKLLGTYEKELHPQVEGIIARKYRHIINIGAGEGYYSVGLARRMRESRFVCYEMDGQNQRLLGEIAALNKVQERIEVQGICTVEALARRIEGMSDLLVICDVEGAEFDLLDPAAIPTLRGADILVELHDMFRPGTTRVLRERFGPTHEVELLHTNRRTMADFPAGVNLEPKLRKAAMNEDRGGRMYWYWMRARPEQ